MFLFSLLLIAIAIGFLRNQVKSVLRLAEAADAWGRGEDIGELRPSGATEVRQAARAISQMRERIIAHQELPIDAVVQQAMYLDLPLIGVPLHPGHFSK